MPTPCFDDDRFISPSEKVMRKAATLCFTCPVFDACKELGKGEPEGVYAGQLPNDPERVAHRRATDRNHECRNGHPREEYGEIIGHLITETAPIWGCRECAGQTRAMLDRAS